MKPFVKRQKNDMTDQHWHAGREWVGPQSRFAGLLGPRQDDNPAEEYSR